MHYAGKNLALLNAPLLSSRHLHQSYFILVYKCATQLQTEYIDLYYIPVLYLLHEHLLNTCLSPFV